MIVLHQPIAGVLLVRSEPLMDERGFFTRVYAVDELAEHGVPPLCSQISLSHNGSARTLRGLHYQQAPHAETKLVRCVAGSIFDVVVDLRDRSPTRGRWLSFVLSRDNLDALVIPEGCAHGFMTLEPDTDVLYQISTPFVPAAAAGIRWDDPGLGIAWPQQPLTISDRDRALPTMDEVPAIG